MLKVGRHDIAVEQSPWSRTRQLLCSDVRDAGAARGRGGRQVAGDRGLQAEPAPRRHPDVQRHLLPLAPIRHRGLETARQEARLKL